MYCRSAKNLAEHIYEIAPKVACGLKDAENDGVGGRSSVGSVAAARILPVDCGQSHLVFRGPVGSLDAGLAKVDEEIVSVVE